MKSSVRILAAAGFVAALGAAPLLSVAQETPAVDPATTVTTSSSESVSVAADGTVVASESASSSESVSTSVAADGTVTATVETSASSDSSSSDAATTPVQ